MHYRCDFYPTREVQLWILGCNEGAAVHTLTQYLFNIYFISFLIFFIIQQEKCSSEYLAVKRLHLSRQLSILWQRRTHVMCFHPSRGGGWGYFSFTIQFDTKYSKYYNGNSKILTNNILWPPPGKLLLYASRIWGGGGGGEVHFSFEWHNLEKRKCLNA